MGYCEHCNYIERYHLHNYAVPAVYDITICYREGEPTIMGVVNAEPCKADIYVRRLPTSDIPLESEQAMSDWLIKVYQEKVCHSFFVAVNILELQPLNFAQVYVVKCSSLL